MILINNYFFLFSYFDQAGKNVSYKYLCKNKPFKCRTKSETLKLDKTEIHKKTLNLKLSTAKIAKAQNTSLTGCLLCALKAGLSAFLIMFFFICTSKLLAYSLNSIQEFTLDISDFVIAFWGFIIFSFIIYVNKSNLN